MKECNSRHYAYLCVAKLGIVSIRHSYTALQLPGFEVIGGCVVGGVSSVNKKIKQSEKQSENKPVF